MPIAILKRASRSLKLAWFATMLAVILPALAGRMLIAATAQAVSPELLKDSDRVEVRIVARGSSVSSSSGNRDSYLAFVSLRGKAHAPMAAMLVDYHADDHDGISDAQIGSSGPLRLYLSYAEYCRMSPKDFLVRRSFDQDAVNRMRGESIADTIPCFIVHGKR